MKPSPPGWPRMSASVWYDDPARAIDWLCKAFGFEVRLKIEGPNGSIEHSELLFGEALIMVGAAKKQGRPEWSYRRSPRELGGANTQCLMFYVDDADEHCRIARENGAKIVSEPTTTDYGEEYWTDRGYEVEDPEGHHFWFYQRLKTGGR